MIVVFTQTAGLTGAEVGVAGGTALLAQRLLEAVFGEDAVRRLTKRAKEQLEARVSGVLTAELNRYRLALAETGVDAAGADRIRAAVSALDATRGEGLAVEAARTASDRSLAAGGAPALEGRGPSTLEGTVLDPVDPATVEGVRVEVDRG